MQTVASPLIWVALVVAGCGSSGSSDPSVDPGTPVADSPLGGDVAGAGFTGKIAISHASAKGPGMRNVYLWEADATCDSIAHVSPRRLLVTGVTWNPGFIGKIDARNASFLVDKGVERGLIVVAEENVASGRIEVVDAPTERGARGRVRIRARSRNHNVEGEVTVLIC